MLSLQVLNTKGAARRLGCSETWIHKLAATGKLRAYIYGEEGELIEHEKETRKQVRALSFLAEDVEQYHPAVQRRPRGSKNRCPQLLTHLFVCTKNQRGVRLGTDVILASPNGLWLLANCWIVW